jgi:hypothetical protein
VTTREEVEAYCKKKGFSADYTSYWLEHPFCEARSGQQSAPPHHIRTRGAGWDDWHWNLLALSRAKHQEIEMIGPREFAVRHPWLAAKISKALSERRSRWLTRNSSL